MSWWKRQVISAHHRYQLGVIFLFIASFFIFIPYLIFIERQNVDMVTWGWYFIIPWTMVYAALCMHLRSRIGPQERVTPLKRPIAHWAAFGILLIYLNVIQTSEIQRVYPAINFAFIVCSLFMADSYWDFAELKKIRR